MRLLNILCIFAKKIYLQIAKCLNNISVINKNMIKLLNSNNYI